MTNIPSFEFTDSDLQYLTYNQYYGENVLRKCLHSILWMSWHRWSMGWCCYWLRLQQKRQLHEQTNRIPKQWQCWWQDNTFSQHLWQRNQAKNATLRNGKHHVLQPDWARVIKSLAVSKQLHLLWWQLIEVEMSIKEMWGRGQVSSVNVFQPKMCPIMFNKGWNTRAFQSIPCSTLSCNIVNSSIPAHIFHVCRVALFAVLTDSWWLNVLGSAMSNPLAQDGLYRKVAYMSAADVTKHWRERGPIFGCD